MDEVRVIDVCACGSFRQYPGLHPSRAALVRCGYPHHLVFHGRLVLWDHPRPFAHECLGPHRAIPPRRRSPASCLSLARQFVRGENSQSPGHALHCATSSKRAGTRRSFHVPARRARMRSRRRARWRNCSASKGAAAAVYFQQFRRDDPGTRPTTISWKEFIAMASTPDPSRAGRGVRFDFTHAQSPSADRPGERDAFPLLQSASQRMHAGGVCRGVRSVCGLLSSTALRAAGAGARYDGRIPSADRGIGGNHGDQ